MLNPRQFLAPVLVVEDDDGVRETVASALIDFGLSVLSAGDAEAALNLMRAHPISAAIIDLRLPGRMSGETLNDILRDAGIPTVLMSGDHVWLDAVRRKNEFLLCLEKPFRLTQLADCLECAAAMAGARPPGANVGTVSRDAVRKLRKMSSRLVAAGEATPDLAEKRQFANVALLFAQEAEALIHAQR